MNLYKDTLRLAKVVILILVLELLASVKEHGGNVWSNFFDPASSQHRNSGGVHGKKK